MNGGDAIRLGMTTQIVRCYPNGNDFSTRDVTVKGVHERTYGNRFRRSCEIITLHMEITAHQVTLATRYNIPTDLGTEYGRQRGA